MLYVGLDIHLKQISACVLDENGKRCHSAPAKRLPRCLQVLPNGQPEQ
jgi:hypothetical protein